MQNIPKVIGIKVIQANKELGARFVSLIKISARIGNSLTLHKAGCFSKT